jgi:hypothetical protein
MKTEKELDLGAPKVPQVPVENTGALSVLRIAAMRLADTRKKPKLKTRDLVGLLLIHSSRAWRHSLPPVIIKISVRAPDGKLALRYSLTA